MRVKVVKKNLDGFAGDAWLVKKGRRYYVVSNTYALFSGPETLVFRSDSNGNVTSWSDITGGRGIGHMEAIKMLEAVK